MFLSRRQVLQSGLAAGLAAVPGRVRAQEDAPVIAVASSLQFAMPDIVAAFRQATGNALKLSFGSTGNFARQIRQGAPYQMFMAADERTITELHRDGFTRDAGVTYGLGRIVVMTPPGSSLKADGTLESLRRALKDGMITRFAIANPEHAPYGVRAKEALIKAGLWADVQPFLVLGENIGQAAQFALSGNAQGGIIALSLSLAPQLKGRGDVSLVPADMHQPLRQEMALMRNAGAVAEQFYSFVQSAPAREIMKAYGFLLPGE